jgi:hypothetical protein
LHCDSTGDGTRNSTSTNYLQAGSDDGDNFTMLVFDEKSGYSTPGMVAWLEPSTVDGNYDDLVETTDNVLCVDASTIASGEIKAYWDSAETSQTYQFAPSDPVVAIIGTSGSFAFSSCGKAITGRVNMPSGTQGTTCNVFDNETAAGFCTNVSTDVHANNYMIIHRSDTFYAAATYELQLEITVDGSTGDNGVYWTSKSVATNGYDTSTLACSPTDGTTWTAVATNASGTTVTTPASDTDCTIFSTNRATKLVVTGGLDLDGDSNQYLYINMPSMMFDTSFTLSGKVVGVNVTLTKAPCNALFGPENFTVGTMGCTETGNCILFPYYTQMTAGADAFWDGFSVANLSTTSQISATITVYEKDGDIGTASVTISAASMYVNTLQNLLGSMTLTTGSALGDSACYVVVTSDGNMDGFAFMGNNNTGQSMGYIPRVSGVPTALCTQ